MTRPAVRLSARARSGPDAPQLEPGRRPSPELAPPPAAGGLAARWAEEELGALERAGLRRGLEPLESPQGAHVRVGGRELVNFSSNDYLGLANDPALADAVRAAVLAHGVGAGASRLIVGDTTAHARLERLLAAFTGTGAARLFNSGWAANTGVIPALCGPGDVVFSDELDHASLIDGCRLSRATVVVYPHRDVAALERLVASHPAPRRLVVTDAVFSMDGDRAPVKALAALCQRQGLALMVDEAHAVGVLGPTGAGLCELEGVTPDLRVGTFSKALGGAGAYVAGSHAVCELLVTRARPLVFSTALPAMLCAAAEVAVARVRSDEALRERLWRNIRHFAAGLRALGLPADEDSAIFSVVLGTPARALAASAELRRLGVLVKPIRPPTVPEGTSRLRFSLSAAHSVDDVGQALEALGAALQIG